MTTTTPSASNPAPAAVDHLRFHRAHEHLSPPFGNDGFARKAEAFARMFGSPRFLLAQTGFVAVWIALNLSGVVTFDAYPFILLNLVFSLQAAYAAPLILLAQTRQAERDRLHADADARHREALAQATAERQAVAAQHSAQLLDLLEQNTRLTEMTRKLGERIEALTVEMHHRMHYIPAVARSQQQAGQPGAQQPGDAGSDSGARQG